jgi:uncharacterized protein
LAEIQTKRTAIWMTMNVHEPKMQVRPFFGVGWGLAGLCPGPAFTALGFGSRAALMFVVAMAAGMVMARWGANRRPSLSRIITPVDPFAT